MCGKGFWCGNCVGRGEGGREIWWRKLNVAKDSGA